MQRRAKHAPQIDCARLVTSRWNWHSSQGDFGDIGPKVLTAELARMLESTITIKSERSGLAKEQGGREGGETLLQTVPKMVLHKYPSKLLGANLCLDWEKHVGESEKRKEGVAHRN